jgi:hypothetical protein
MSVKASLRRALLTLVAGAALAYPIGAKADFLGGLSVRAGAFFPTRQNARDLTDFAAWGGGIEYKVPWFPKLLTGEAWSTSISVDFHYSERKAGILRYIPVSINQVYTFEEQNGHAPYAGFCITAATFGTTGTVPKQPTVTRFGGGLILGLNVDTHFYVEGRYEWFDKHHALETPEGFRAYLGYRF